MRAAETACWDLANVWFGEIERKAKYAYCSTVHPEDTTLEVLAFVSDQNSATHKSKLANCHPLTCTCNG
jgi:hypothetical protein